MSNHDPNTVIQAANDKLSQNDFEGGQMLFQSALLDWVDEARETMASNLIDVEPLKEAIATLWIAYASFLIQAKQFKSATEAYEQAVQCPVGSTVGRLWLEYARFAEERGNRKSAQDIYIRALCPANGQPSPISDDQDQSLIWEEFLQMMQQSNTDLTMADLKSAVQQESSNAVPVETTSSAGIEQPDAKRFKANDTISATTMSLEQSTFPVSTPALGDKTHVVTPESVQIEAEAFTEALAQTSVPSDIAAVWMMRDGNGPAQPPDRTLFTPKPPKLSDPVRILVVAYA